MTLPVICRFGKTGLEKKLLMYYACRPFYRFEFRVADSTNYDPTMMPPLLGESEFVPLYEIGVRVFMFEKKSDRDVVQRYFESLTPERKRREPRSTTTRRPRKKVQPRLSKCN